MEVFLPNMGFASLRVFLLAVFERLFNWGDFLYRPSMQYSAAACDLTDQYAVLEWL